MILDIQPIGQRIELRNAFIEKFVRKNELYEDHIEKVVQRNGFPYYNGFLWEFLYYWGQTDAKVMSEREGLEILKDKDEVLFMFDWFFYADEQEKPKIPVFDRPDWQHLIYKAKAECLISPIWERWHGDFRRINLTPADPVALPGSVYVFDASLTWYLAFTEENIGQKRLCFKCGV